MNIRRRAILSALVVAIVATFPLQGARAGASDPADSKIPYLIKERIQALRSAKEAPAPTRGQASKAEQALARAAQGLLRVDASGALYVEVHARGPLNPQNLKDIESLGGRIESSTVGMRWPRGLPMPKGLGIVVAWIPFDKLEAVAAFDWVAVIRPVEESEPDIGNFLSEGVALHLADELEDLDIDGTGVTVGAISDGIDSLAAAQGSGDLPATVTVPGGCPAGAGSGDEGTAMLEIVHDMAPGAALMFCGTGGGVANHVNALLALQAAGADVITEDIPFDAEPAFQQGLAAVTGDTIAAAGVSVHSSAGNQATRHAARVQAVGTGGGPDGSTGPYAGCPGGFSPDNVVAIAPGSDTTFDVQVQPGTTGATLGVTLQWSEPRAIFPTAGAGGFTDLNLYVMNSTLTSCLGASVGVQGNGAGDTIEQVSIPFAAGGNVNVKLVVDVQNAPAGIAAPTLDLRWRGAVATDGTTRDGSLNPDSNYTGIATSAAAANAGGSTNPANVAIEAFSSGGPVQLLLTTVCSGGVYPCPGNATAGPAATVRGAPDWTAADGVSVSGAGGFGSGTCPGTNQGDCRFFGTSAAAPHAAACDALIRSNNVGITVAEVNDRLGSAAVDRGPAGFDNTWGEGVLDCLRAAIQSDLSVTKTDSPDPVVAGEDLTYTLEVRNDGPNASPLVTVSDTLPTGLSFLAAGSSQTCTAAGAGTVECTATDLASGANTQFTVVARVAADLVHNNGGPLSVVNTATVSGAGLDRNPSNDAGTASTDVVAVADLEVVSMSADAPAEALIGQSVSVTVTTVVDNNGPSAPMNALLSRSATAPAGSSVSPNDAEDPLDALGLNENRELTHEYTVVCQAAGVQTFSFVAEIQPASDDDNDPNQGNNQRSVDVQLDCVIPVAINIKPRSFPNSINVNDSGLTPVAVLTTRAGEYGLPLAFNASSIVASTVRLGPEDAVWSGTGGAMESDGTGALERSYELDERTRDKDLDMLLHFPTRDTGIIAGDTVACVKGQGTDINGNPAKFFGCDSVRAIASN